MKPSLAAAVKRAQASLLPKPVDDEDEGFDPLAIAAQELVEAKSPQARAEAAAALVELAQHRKS